MKNVVYIFIGLLFLLSSCQEDDDFSDIETSLEASAATNASAAKLLRLMQTQEGSTEKLGCSLNGRKPLFQFVTIGATSDFGVYYQIPYADSEGTVEGFIVYPVDEQINNMSSRRSDGILGNPVDIDGTYLNNNIPVTHRLLYAAPLLDIKAKGIAVDNSLTSFADRLCIGPQKVSLSDVPQEDRRLITRTMLPYGYAEGYVTIDYIMGTYRGTNFSDDEVTSYGFSIDSFMKIVENEFNKIGAWRVKFVDHVGFQKLCVVFSILDTDRVYANWPYFMDEIIRNVKDDIFQKKFTVSMQYLMNLPDKSQIEKPSRGGGGGGTGSGGGTYTGGSVPGSPSAYDPYQSDTLTFVHDDKCPDANYIDSVAHVRSLFDKTVGTLSGKTKAYEAYLDTVKNADVEYSASLHKYDDDYAIDSIVKGEQYKVDNYVTPSSIANVHNHTNGTPPSFRDILFTAKTAKNKKFANYKATFVYDNKNKIYYVLYIKDRAQAAQFYDKYCNYLDEETNGVKNLGIPNLITQKKSKDFLNGHTNLLYEDITILSKDSGMSLFKIENNNIMGYTATPQIKKEKTYYIFKTYSK